MNRRSLRRHLLPMGLAAAAMACAQAQVAVQPPALPQHAANPPASVADAVAALCSGAPASTSMSVPDPDVLDSQLRRSGETVQTQACQAWPLATGPVADRLALLLAEAGMGGSQRTQAGRLLSAMGAPPATTDETVRGAWHLASGRLAFDGGAAPAAVSHFREARAAFEAAGRGRSLMQARTLVRLSHALRSTLEVGLAAKTLDEAEGLLVALGHGQALEMADVHNARALIAYSRLDREATLRHAQAELAIYRAAGLGDSTAPLHALGNIGGILSQLQRMPEAEAALREGLRLMDLHPDAAPSAQIGILVNLAALELSTGQLEAALVSSQRGVDTALRLFGPGSLRSVTSSVQLAKARARLGRYDEALAALTAAERIIAAHPGSAAAERRVWIAEARADVYSLLGDMPGLEAAVADGLALSQGSAAMRRWRGALLRSQGIGLARRGQWADAERAFAEGAEVFAALSGPHHAFTLELRAATCMAQVARGGTADACAIVRDTLPQLDAAAPQHRYRAHAALAAQARAADNHALAYAHQLQALAAARRLGGPHPAWEALSAVAADLRRQGRREAAVFVGKQAVQAVEALRARINAASASLEGVFLADKLETYRSLARWLAEDGRLDEALVVMRLLREEEFHQFMLRDGRLQSAATRAPLTGREGAMAGAWERLGTAPGAAGPGGEAAHATELRDLLAGWADAPAAVAGPAPRSSMALAPGVLRVSSIEGEGSTTLIYESARGRSVQVLPWPRAQLNAEVAALLGDIESGTDARPRLRQLHDRIGAPIVRRARADGARTVELLLDGTLRYLPFAALHDGRRTLGEQLVLVRRLGAPVDRSPGKAPRRLLAFGASQGGNGLAALPEVAAELCHIVDGPVTGTGPAPRGCRGDGHGRGHWPGQGWLDGRFTAGTLASALSPSGAGEGGLLHVGTHFVLRPGNVARSWLLLGDGARMHLDELTRLDFSGQRLVTLSACETAIGSHQGDGREVDGLSGLVLRRGARAVLASLWRVDDRATRELMEHFYAALRSRPPAAALQFAQETLRRTPDGPWASARHWAAFVLTEQ